MVRVWWRVGVVRNRCRRCLRTIHVYPILCILVGWSNRFGICRKDPTYWWKMLGLHVRSGHRLTIFEIGVGRFFVKLMRLYDGIFLGASFVLRSNFTGIVLKIDLIVLRRWNQKGWLLYRSVDKIQTHTPFACSIRLATILTYGRPLVTFEMPFTASQATRSHSFRF